MDKNEVLANQVELHEQYAKTISEVDPTLGSKVSGINSELKSIDYTGLVKVVDDQAYHQGIGLSRSGIIDAMRTPYRYFSKHLKDYDKVKPVTSAMTLGDMCHRSILEPETVDQEYESDAGIIADLSSYASPRSTKAFKEFRARIEETGKRLVPADQFDMMRTMRDSVWTHPQAKELLANGLHERAAYVRHPDKGLVCRVKPDSIVKGARTLIDIKTTADVSHEVFSRKIYSDGYHIQAGYYLRVMSWLTGEPWDSWMFICVENTYPYEVAVYELDAGSIDLGDQTALKTMEVLSSCFARKTFHSYSRQATPIAVPHYAFNKE